MEAAAIGDLDIAVSAVDDNITIDHTTATVHCCQRCDDAGVQGEVSEAQFFDCTTVEKGIAFPGRGENWSMNGTSPWLMLINSVSAIVRFQL